MNASARTPGTPSGVAAPKTPETASKVSPATTVVPPPASGPASPVSPTAGPTAPFAIQADVQRLPWMNLLVYGEYGTGKTWLAGTAADVPEMQDVLMISAEGGELTLWDPEHQFDMIDPIKARSYREVARVYDFLKAHCASRDSNTPEAEGRLRRMQNFVMPPPEGEPEDFHRLRRYRTVIIDSLTEVEIYCMNQLLGVTDATKIDEESGTAEWAQYRQQHGMVQRLIRQFRDLPVHIIFTCARAYVADELKRHIYSPMMTGKLSSQVQGFMDMVGYLVIGASEDPEKLPPRRMYIVQSPRFAAKSRFSTYKGNYFDNPSMESILRDVGMLRFIRKPGAAPVNAVKSS